MPNMSTVDSDISTLCTKLYEIAQRHTPTTCFSDVNELVQLTKILKQMGISVTPATKFKAETTDYSPTAFRHSIEYRLLHARYAAALGTIADMGSRKIRKNKDEYHAGVQAGLRKAADVAIMFLEDLDNPSLEPRSSESSVKDKSFDSFVR